MLDEDNKPFDIRDKFALEILILLLNLSKKPNDLYETYRKYLDYDYSNKPNDVIENIKNGIIYDLDRSDKEFTKYVRQAYRMADIIRKVRLSVFE